jgi:hypothetical protein
MFIDCPTFLSRTRLLRMQKFTSDWEQILPEKCKNAH